MIQLPDIDADKVVAWLEWAGYKPKLSCLEGCYLVVLHDDEPNHVGFGDTKDDAALDLLRKLFNTKAAETLFNDHLASKLTKVAVSSLDELEESLDADVFDPAYPLEVVEDELREAGLDPEKIARDGEELVARLQEDDEPEPEASLSGLHHYTLIEAAPEGQTPSKDQVAEALSKLDDLVTEIDDTESDLALSSSLMIRFHILGWIAQARTIEDAVRTTTVTDRVHNLARRLTDLCKRFWPGSVFPLQIDAKPSTSIREFPNPCNVKVPKNWAEVAEAAAMNMERTFEEGFDEHGWADTRRFSISEADAQEVMSTTMGYLETIGAGDVNYLPPRGKALVREQADIKKLMKLARAMRTLRANTNDPDLWGRIFGRMRWVCGVLPKKSSQALHNVVTGVEPATASWAWRPADDRQKKREAKQKRRQQVSVVNTVPNPDADQDTLVEWLKQAFEVFTNPDIGSLAADLREQIQALDSELFDKRSHRSRFRRLCVKHLNLAGKPFDSLEVIGIEEVDDGDDDDDSTVVPLVVPASDQIFDEVRGLVNGKHALFVRSRYEPKIQENLEKRLGMKITWSEGEYAQVRSNCQQISNGKFDLVIVATGFLRHGKDDALCQASKTANVPYIRVAKGRPLATARGLKRVLAHG